MVKKISLIFVGVICISVAIAFLLVLIRSPRLRSFTGQLPSYSAVQTDARLTLLAQILPSTARDISYYIRPHAPVIYVDFTISETEFLEWVAARGWKPMKIDTGQYLEASPLNAGLLCIEKGYYYNEKSFGKDNPRMLITERRVFYDMNKTRCFYRFTGAD